PWSRNGDKGGSVLGWSACGQWCGQGRSRVAAEQSCLELLIRAQSCEVHRRGGIFRDRHSSSYESTIVTPVEDEPRAGFAKLILKMCGVLEPLVMIDAESSGGRRRCSSGSTDLWREKARRDARHDH